MERKGFESKESNFFMGSKGAPIRLLYTNDAPSWSERQMLCGWEMKRQSGVITFSLPKLGQAPSYDEGKERMGTNYHPIFNFLSFWNLILPKGLVKMSAQLLSVPPLTTWRFPFWIWSWKWWYFKEMCFVHGLKWVLVVARIIQALLSSNICEGAKGAGLLVGCWEWRDIKQLICQLTYDVKAGGH